MFLPRSDAEKILNREQGAKIFTTNPLNKRLTT